MKTTKKGFTLIELIVVIAIIGVLAAILVPTMLGYVKKSKISSANSAASSVYKAINSALTELDEEGVDVGGLWILDWDGHKWGAESKLSTASEGNLGHSDTIGTDKPFDRKVSNFFEDITKEKAGCAAIKGGSCIAVAVCGDTTYTGTYPGGIVNTDSYELYSDAPATALRDAVCVASGEFKASDCYTITKKKATSVDNSAKITNEDLKVVAGSTSTKVKSKPSTWKKNATT